MNGGQAKLAAALMSKILVIRFWKDAKFGTNLIHGLEH